MTAVTLLLPDEFRTRIASSTRAQCANVITPPLFSQPELNFCHRTVRQMGVESSVASNERARRNIVVKHDLIQEGKRVD